MRILLSACVAALFVSACQHPTLSTAVGQVSRVRPGESVIDNLWAWDRQQTPSDALVAILDREKTPPALASFMQSSYEWRDDYDTGRFLSPDELVSQRYGVCSAFARFWTFALGRLGYKADFVAFWGPSSAHAIAVFRDAGGTYRLASNQFFYDSLDLGHERDAAIVRAAQEFYGSQWSVILVFDPEGGVIRQKIVNEALAAAPMTPPQGRGVFAIKR